MFNPFSAVTSKIYGAVAIAALLGLTVQTARVASRDATIERRDVKIVELRGLFHQANSNHRQTKSNYREAQAAAAELEAQRLARVQAEQQEITDEVVSNYRRRIAAARADYERLRREAGGAGEGARGAADAEHLPESGDAAGGAARAAEDPRLSLPRQSSGPVGRDELDWRLVATEQAIQLDELISWVERQAGVDPNR